MKTIITLPDWDENNVTRALQEIFLNPDKPITVYPGGANLPGYVYFLRALNGYTKIGETNDLQRRIARHRKRWTGEYAFELAWVIEANRRYYLEDWFHAHFYCLRRRTKRGDWFLLTPQDMAAIRLRYPLPYLTISNGGAA